MRSIVVAFACSLPLAATAATFTVTRVDDPNPNGCTAEDCSLREAVIASNAAAGADDIVLPAGTYVLSRTGVDDVASTGDLDLQADVTLTGAGSADTVIDAQGKSRIFQVDPEGDGNLVVRIVGLTVANGADTFGGGILNLADLTLEDVVVRDSVANNGGGIYNLRALTARQSRLSGNGTSDPVLGYGGGIRSDGGTVVLENTLIVGNTASRSAAGLYLVDAELTMRDGSAFEGNETTAAGGAAIEAFGTASRIDASDCRFEANRGEEGGAIVLLGGPVANFVRCTFRANEAFGTNFGGGGAIFAFNATLGVADSSFDANRSQGEGGGAIHVGGDAGTTLTLTDVDFTANRADCPASTEPEPCQLDGSSHGLGGALLVIAGSTVEATGTSFSVNVAGVAGGGAYVDRNATLTIDQGRFERNEVDRQFGGAIASEGTVTVRRSTFEGNTAMWRAGAISNGIGWLTVEDSEFSANASADAGAIWVGTGSSFVMRRSALIGNSATGDIGLNQGRAGGLLYEIDVGLATPPGVIENTLFDGNTATVGTAMLVTGAIGSNPVLRLTHVTLVDDQNGDTVFANAGATVAFKSSVVSGRCAGTGIFDSFGDNIESPGDGCGFDAANDLTDVAAPTLALGPLEGGGGVTRCRVPQPGSVAIDHVDDGSSCVDVQGGAVVDDQHGTPRPFDGDTLPGARCDAGAKEFVVSDVLLRDGFETFDPSPAGGACGN